MQVGEIVKVYKYKSRRAHSIVHARVVDLFTLETGCHLRRKGTRLLLQCMDTDKYFERYEDELLN